MSEELPVGLATAESIWIKHLKRSKDFVGSDQEYCDQNGLKLSTFGHYKRKYGFVKKSKPKEKSTNFKRIAVAAPPRAKPMDLQSPEWVAKFLKEFLN